MACCPGVLVGDHNYSCFNFMLFKNISNSLNEVNKKVKKNNFCVLKS